MNTFIFKEEPIPFIRRDMLGRPEDEVLAAERRFRQYLNLALRIFEAENPIEPNHAEV